MCEQFNTLINHIIILHENQIREDEIFLARNFFLQSNAKTNMQKNKMDILITNLHSWGENLLEGQWMHHGELQNKINHSMFCEIYMYTK